MTAARRDPSGAADSLRAGVSELADVLFRMDTSPELSLVRDRGQLKGRSSKRAAEASDLLDRLWLHFPVLKDAADAVDKALAEGDRGTLADLLDGDGVTLPDGSTSSAPDLLARLRRDADRANTAVTEVATAWRNALPRLDALSTRLQAARAIADELGMPSDPELAAARSVVDELVAAATADPLGVHTDVSKAEQLVERSVARLEELRRTKATIGADLDAAEARLDQLAGLISAGAGARAAAETRIEGVRGLVEPLDPSVLDTGDRALRPWLARLRAQAAAGAWPAAAESLEHWQEAAAELQARASAVAATNRAPLERRNDLRGLLDAYRAKAAAIGLAEDPKLTNLYRAAHEALYAYRCDVQQAEMRVRDYGRAIGAVR
jgi:hypothetical protein